MGQRVRNTQPEGGASGEGSSPFNAVTSRPRSISGSGTGAVAMSAWV